MSQIEEIGANHISLPNGKWEVAGEMYRTSCHCKSEDHALTFYVDVDKDYPLVSLHVTLQSEHFSDVWDYPAWSRPFRSFWKRVKNAWKLLTTGYVEVQSDFIFRGDEQIDALVDALKESKEVVKSVLEEQEQNVQSN